MTSKRGRDLKSVFMVLLGVGALISALLLEPRPDEFTYLLGERFGGPCSFRELSGFACPQCGMTRSFVWAARGAWATAWHYSPGGFTLFLGIELTAVIGLIRWVRRTPEALRLSQRTWILVLLVWAIGLVLAPWGLRIAGLCALP